MSSVRNVFQSTGERCGIVKTVRFHDLKRPKSSKQRETWPPLQDAFEDSIQAYRRRRETPGAFGKEETRMILCLIRGMLRFNPEDRLTTHEISKSDWDVEYALREL